MSVNLGRRERTNEQGSRGCVPSILNGRKQMAFFVLGMSSFWGRDEQANTVLILGFVFPLWQGAGQGGLAVLSD